MVGRRHGSVGGEARQEDIVDDAAGRVFLQRRRHVGLLCECGGLACIGCTRGQDRTDRSPPRGHDVEAAELKVRPAVLRRRRRTERPDRVWAGTSTRHKGERRMRARSGYKVATERAHRASHRASHRAATSSATERLQSEAGAGTLTFRGEVVRHDLRCLRRDDSCGSCAVGRSRRDMSGKRCAPRAHTACSNAMRLHRRVRCDMSRAAHTVGQQPVRAPCAVQQHRQPARPAHLVVRRVLQA